MVRVWMRLNVFFFFFFFFGGGGGVTLWLLGMFLFHLNI